MLAEFTVIPLEGGPHFSDKVAELINIIKESGLPYKLTAMGTIIEGDWNAVMAVIKKCHFHILKNNVRASTSIKIDDFQGRTGRLEGKVKSVLKKVKKVKL